MNRPCALLLLLVASLTATSCNLFKTQAHIESDTSWSGSFDGRTIDGRGSRTIDLGGGTGAKCAVVQKQTREGFLTLKIDDEERTTTAAFGVVSVCGGSAI